MTAAIQFSGGKDSLALLYLLAPIWDECLVMWVNTGKAHESTLQLMEQVKQAVPNFVEVVSDQNSFVQRFGYPADVVPSYSEPFAQSVLQGSQPQFVSSLRCCAHNIWLPLANAVKHYGVDTVYRGQKNSDLMKSPIQDGHVEDGVTYRFPLQDWTDEQVVDFLGPLLPQHYRAGEVSSRDCWDCTAHLHHNAQRIRSLPPSQRVFVQGKLRELMAQLDAGRSNIQDCLR